jgi:hypothetical protein
MPGEVCMLPGVGARAAAAATAAAEPPAELPPPDDGSGSLNLLSVAAV